MDVLETVPEDETDLDRRIFDFRVIDSHMLTRLFVGLNGNAFTVRSHKVFKVPSRAWRCFLVRASLALGSLREAIVYDHLMNNIRSGRLAAIFY